MRRQIFGIVSVALISLGVVMLLGSALVIPRTLQNDREIERAFIVTAAWISDFQARNGHLPTQAEFVSWAASQSGSPWIGNMQMLPPSDAPGQLKKKVDAAPEKSAFLLGVW